MAKINIQNAKISSSANYGLVHGTTTVAEVTSTGISGSLTSTASFGVLGIGDGSTPGTNNIHVYEGGANNARISIEANNVSYNPSLNLRNNNADGQIELDYQASNRGDMNFKLDNDIGGALGAIMSLRKEGHVEFVGANQKISGSLTSTASFGNLIVSHGNSGQTPQTNVAKMLVESDDSLNGIQLLGGTSQRQFILFGDDNADVGFIEYSHIHNHMRLVTNSNESFKIEGGASGRISGSGTSTGSFGNVHVGSNLGIGTTNPSQKLDVVGDIVIGGASDSRLKFFSGAARAHIAPDQNVEIRFGFSNASDKLFYHSTTEVVKINGNGITVSSGNVSGSTSSTGSFGSLVTSGDIQAGGAINIPFGEVLSFEGDGGNTRVYSNQEDQIFFDIGGVTANVKFQETNNVFAQRVTTLEDFVSSATGMAFSGSSSSTGSFGRIVLPNNSNLNKIVVGANDGGKSLNVDNSIYLSSGNQITWANGDARLIEGTPNNYDLSVGGYDGSGGFHDFVFGGGSGNVFSGSAKSTGSFGAINIGPSGIDTTAALQIYDDTANNANIGAKIVISGDWNETNIAYGGNRSPGITIRSLDSTAGTFGTFSFMNASGYTGATIIAKHVLHGAGTGNMDTQLHFGTRGVHNPQGGAHNVSAMVIDEDGLVGIATDNPQSQLHVAGDIRADGDIIANQLIVSSSVTHLTQSFSSGSTIFGDTNDDLHSFTGSINASGSITSRGATGYYAIKINGDNTGGPQIHFGDNDTTPNNFMVIGAFGSINNINTQARDFRIYDSGGFTGFYFDVSANNVGIGTTTPDNTLTINGGVSVSGSAPMIKFKDVDDNSFSRIYHSAGRLILDADHSDGTQLESSNIMFRVDDSTKMFISGSGDVGIGTDSPEQLLHLKAESAFLAFTDTSNNGQAGILYRNTSGTNVGFAAYNFSTNDWQVRTNNNLALTIDSAGNIEFPRASTISGSSTSTGSFGLLQTTDRIQTPSDSLSLKGNLTLDGTNIPTLHLDGLVDAVVRIDKAHSYRAAHLRFDTGGSANWFVGTPDSDNYGDGDELYFGTSQDTPIVAIDPNASTGLLNLTTNKISGSLVSTGSFGKMRIGEVTTNSSAASTVVISGKDDPGANNLLELMFDNSPEDTGVVFTDINGTIKNRITIDAASASELEIASLTDIRFTTGGVTDGGSGRLLTLDGNKISGSLASTGSFGAVHAADKVRIGLTDDGSPHLLEMKAGATGGDFIQGRQSDGGQAFRVGLDSGDDGFLELGSAGTSNMVVLRADGASHFNGGNVGIGNSDPPEALTVTGDISASLDIHLGGRIRHAGELYINPTTNLRLLGNIITFGSVSGTEYARFDSSGNFNLKNNKSINFENTSGTAKSILAVDSSNITKLGDNSNSGVLQLSSGTATFSGKIRVDEIEGSSNNVNTLLLNDDQTAAVNMVTMQSINHINMMTDGNNNGVGSFKVLNGSYDVDTADLAFEIGSDSSATFSGDVNIADTKTLGTSTFISGITGDGFRIDDNGSDGTFLEVDNIFVRNTLRTHIFQKDIVKATNGILFVSDSGIVSGSTGTTGTGTVTFDNTKSATFSDNDILLFKDAQDNGTINAVRFQINGSVSTAGDFDTYNVDNVTGNLSNLNVGGTVARISGGTIAIDASSNNSPFIDVNKSSGSAVVRLGNLAGITSPKFGTLSNFGLYASGSAFLEGTINASAGEIAGWAIRTGSMAKDDLSLDGTNAKIIAGNGGVDTGTSNIRAVFGKFDGTNYGMRVWKGNDATTYVKLSSDGTNVIAGWNLATGSLYNTSSQGGLIMDAGGRKYVVTTGSIYDSDVVTMGDITDTGKFGIKGKDTEGNLMFKLGMDGNIIAGWEISSSRIVDSTKKVQIDAGNSRFLIQDSSGNQRVRMGLLNATQYGISGSDSSGNLVFKLGEAGNEIAGWTIATGKISSGTDIELDATNKRLAINNNQMAFGFDAGGSGLHGLHIDATNHIYSSGEFIFGSTGSNGQFISASNGNIEISSSNFHLTNAGNVTMRGTITATGGKIGGYTIGSDILSSGAGNTQISLIDQAGGNTQYDGDDAGGLVFGRPHALFGHSFTGSAFLQNSQGKGYFRAGDNGGFIEFRGGSDGNGLINISGSKVNISASNFTIANGNVSMSGSVSAQSGDIGNWIINSDSLQKDNVFLTSSVDEAGLIIRDSSQNILSVISSSAQTDINVLTGSKLDVTTTGVDSNLTDFKFDSGSNNHEVSRGPGGAGTAKWTTGQVDGASTTIPHWLRDNTASRINEGSFCASIDPFTVAAADVQAGSEMATRMHRAWPAAALTTTVQAVAKAHDFKKFGDGANLKATLTMEVSASNDRSDNWVTVSRKAIDFTSEKFVKLSTTFKNSGSFVGVTFSYDLAMGVGKEAVGVGGFSVDSFNINNVVTSASLVPAGFTVARTKPFIEITQHGMIMYSSEKEFIRLNDDGFEFKGGATEFSKISVAEQASVTGSMTIDGPLVVSGALRLDPSVPIGFGTDAPESQMHIVSDFSDVDSFQVGTNPSWDVQDLRAGYSVRTTLTPFTDSATDHKFVQAAYGSDTMFDSYRFPSMLLHGTQHIGQHGFAGQHFDMSQSVHLGRNQSFHDQKRQIGMFLRQHIGALHRDHGNSQREGLFIEQRRDYAYGPATASITGSATNPDDFVETGIFIKQMGNYDGDVEKCNSELVTSGEEGRIRAGLFYQNAASGSHGQTTGWGIYISGSQGLGKNYFSGKVGIGYSKPSQSLDVQGTGSFSNAVGIGVKNPDTVLHVRKDDTSTVGTNDGIKLAQAGSGDVGIEFLLVGATQWFTYIDNSDSDKFKIRRSTSDYLVITETGNVGINDSSPEAHLTVSPSTVGTTSLGGRSINYGVNINTASGRSGVTVKPANNYAIGDDNAGFQWLYPFDDGGNGDFKAFRVSEGATLVDKFYATRDGQGYFASNVGIGTSSPDTNLHLYSSDSGNVPILKLTQDNADASAALITFEKKNSTSEADDDRLGTINFNGRDTNNTLQTFVQIGARAADVTSATEDGRLEFRAITNGTLPDNPPSMVLQGKQLGVGTDSPTAVRADFVSATNTTSNGIVRIESGETGVDTGDRLLVLDFSGDSSINSNNDYIQFQDSSGEVGRIHSEVLYGTFTGGHVSQRPSGSSFASWKPGMVLKSTGKILATGSSMGLAWPEVDLTTTQKDKAVMGVWEANNPSGSHNDKYLDKSLPRINYNSVGEGRIRVTDTNGNIETGDYLCSSTRTGHAEKQDDDLLHNYTIAKATEPYNFASASNDSDFGYKSVLIACTYHCG